MKKLSETMNISESNHIKFDLNRLELYKQEFSQSVYNESVPSLYYTRYWISFDFEDSQEKNRRIAKLYEDWAEYHPESWGDSVISITHILPVESFFNKVSPEDWLKTILIKAELIDSNVQRSDRISIYVSYFCSFAKIKFRSYVLVQNTMPHYLDPMEKNIGK